MAWRRLRLGVFTLLGAAFVLIGSIVRGAGVHRVGCFLLMAFASLGALLVLIVGFDVVYHALRGEGQACRRCGHVQRMRSFRLSGACPNCGEE